MTWELAPSGLHLVLAVSAGNRAPEGHRPGARFRSLPCPRCGGDGYAHLFGRLYTYPCRRCRGTGERARLAYRIYTALRHGAPEREDY